MIKLGTYGKAWGVLSTGGIGWATQVVASPSSSVTAPEWVGLATIIVATVTAFLISNAPASVPAIPDE